MIDVTQDIHSLTTFKRNSSGLMKHMKKTGRPLVLTVNGKAEAVVLDAKAYQEVASQLDAMASIRRSLAQARRGAGRSADEVLDDLEREDASWHGLRGALKEVFAENGGGEAYLRAEPATSTQRRSASEPSLLGIHCPNRQRPR
jgi:prevent-host-death family protein